MIPALMLLLILLFINVLLLTVFRIKDMFKAFKECFLTELLLLLILAFIFIFLHQTRISVQISVIGLLDL